MHSATPTGECRSWNAHASLLCTLLLIGLLFSGCGKEAVYLAAGSETGSAADESESADEAADADDADKASDDETEAGDGSESERTGVDGSAGGTGDSDSESDADVLSDSNADSDFDEIVSSGSDVDDHIYVYVCGAVESPGLYQLEQGSRVYDAITAAGGLRDDASEDYWNQAAYVSDGQMIDVPTEVEVQAGLADASGSGAAGGTDASSGSNASGGDMDASSGSGAAGSGTDDSSEADTSGSDSSSGTSSSGLININTATADELMQIPGIGEARAEAIISYREESGGFSSIEDIKNVSGIGDALFDKMKNYIEV